MNKAFLNTGETFLLAAIQAGGQAREDAWLHITQTWGAYILKVAIQNSACSPDEAREAYSIAVVGVDKRIRMANQGDFLQKASLKTYLTKSAYYAALEVKKQRRPVADPEDYAGKLASEDFDQRLRQKECRLVMEKALDGIGGRCKTILLLFNDGYSMEEIALKMGFKAEVNAKNEKYKCQDRFKSYLITNPGLKKSLTEACYG